MDSLNPEQHKFDWDNISVGCTQLDHSQNFFARKHSEHERWDDMEFGQQKIIKTEENENKENKSKCSSPIDVQKLEYKALPSIKVEEIIEKQDLENSSSDSNKDALSTQDSCCKASGNLVTEWSTIEPKIANLKGAVPKNMPPPPHAYLVKDIYQRKREEAARRRAEEERKMREFHSRPAPSFNNNCPFLQSRRKVHAITKPITPEVLKKSRETDEKRRKKLEEWKQKNQLPKFEPRPPTVLKERPFVPEKKAFVVEQRPFNLHLEKRLQERRHYDEVRQKAMEEKIKQAEIEKEERERHEKEIIREIRKAATFKARPNPFKK